MSWRTKVGRRLAWERGTMNVGDRVKWVPTGQEGRIFEVRDGGIVAVRGEDWAVYDYADRFELVNECRVKPADVLDRAFDPEAKED